jgi:hypothetical protein
LVCSKHIHKCHPAITIKEAQELINTSILDIELKSINLLRKKEFGEKYSKKFSHLHQAIIEIYNEDKFRFSHGKSLYKAIKSKIHGRLKCNSKLEVVSEHLLIEKLHSIGKQIW